MADKPPAVDPQLVDWLSRVYPDECPNLSDSDREIWIAVGEVGVVKYLRGLLNAQTEEQLD